MLPLFLSIPAGRSFKLGEKFVGKWYLDARKADHHNVVDRYIVAHPLTAGGSSHGREIDVLKPAKGERTSPSEEKYITEARQTEQTVDKTRQVSNK